MVYSVPKYFVVGFLIFIFNRSKLFAYQAVLIENSFLEWFGTDIIKL